MGTTFDSIIDLALVSIQDYKLDKLCVTSPDNFEKITNAFLIRGLPNFTCCKKSLAYDTAERKFVVDLEPLEISILADLWVYEWMNWHVNNVTQFENKMTPSDFKHYSEAENLKQKSEQLDKIREKFNQKMIDYQLKYNDWSGWAGGSYL